MAVQIPTVNRAAPEAPDTVGRMDVSVPDTSREFAQNSAKVDKIGDHLVDYQIKAEDHAGDLVATGAATEYEAKVKSEAKRLLSVEGDPTPAYQEFFDNEKTWRDDVTKKYENVDDRTKQKIQDKISHVYSLNYDTWSVNQAVQRQAYDNNLTDSSVKLKQDGLLDAAGILRNDDPQTMNLFRARYDDMRQPIIEQGERNGLVTTNADGEQVFSPILLEQLRKKTSEGLVPVIQTLNSTGKTEEAKALLDEYGDQLTAKDRVRLLNQSDESDVKNKAMLEFDAVKNLDPMEAFQKLSNVKDPAVSEKARSMLDTYRRQMHNFEQDRAEKSFNKLYDVVQKEGINSKEGLEDHPAYGELKNNLNAKQKRALVGIVTTPPKESDPDTKKELYESMFSGQMKNMPIDEFLNKTKDLNAKDRTTFENFYRQSNSQTATQQKSMLVYGGNRLMRELQAQGAIKQNQFGKYSNSDQIKITQAYDNFAESMANAPENMSVGDVNKLVKDHAVEFLKSKVFLGPNNKPAPPPAPKFNSGAPATPPPSGPTAYSTLPENMKNAWVQKFMNVNGRMPNPKQGDNMDSFIKEQGGKL